MRPTKYRKITRGLYGTGVHRSVYPFEFLPCECSIVEEVLDMYTTLNDGCWERYICPCGNMTDILGEWYPTLRDAKAAHA
jgi:hypothetical protein